MNNPIATIDNSIPEPADPQVVRTTFTRIIYSAQKFFIYGDGEYDNLHATFDPTGKGQEFYMIVPMSDALTDWYGSGLPIKPDFVSNEAWEGLQKSGSAFVTAVNSVMPKIIIPSDILVDNGLLTNNDTFIGFYQGYDLFSWEIVSFNGVPIGATTTKTNNYANVGPNYGSQYISIKAKDDLEYSNTVVLKLVNPTNPPLGSAHDWLKANSTNLVVGRAPTDGPNPGAFVLMLNVVPTRSASASAEAASKNPWSVTLEFGEVKMIIQDTGSTEITIGAAGSEQNKTTVNLAEGKAKGGPLQQQHVTDKDPFIILIYPVWNGLVVASGVQDAVATVFSSSYYVPKLKEASAMAEPYSKGFNPQSPTDVEVGVGSLLDVPPTYVMVDFGSSMNVTAKNCRFDIAYLPCFFSKKCWFDEYRTQSDDQPGVATYSYDVYPIWTKNGTAAVLNPAPAVDATSYPGTIAGTVYCYTQWRMNQDHFNRIGSEIFGSIFKIQETLIFPIKNGNGNFNITYTPVTGSDPGDPNVTSNWADYIQTISVTTNIDGSNGTITVDKYGFAGQQSEVNQSIGAITIAATGGYGTVAGSIFMGLGMGIADNQTSSGAVWTIPLIGLGKKMEDIALINAPFLDGETFSVASDFLCRYSGIVADLSFADPAVQLGTSDDINVVRFDWKAGTTVKSALDDVMADIVHSYVVRDGKIFFYKLDPTTSLPFNLGPDWSSDYPNAKVVLYDKTPDFDDLRNEVIVMGLEQDAGGQGADIAAAPTFPRTEVRSTVTIPDVPWAKVLSYPISGYAPPDYLARFADNLIAQHARYELLGRTTIAGNAQIKPYDRWGEFVISGVTHNMDFKSKTWTTDLEFMRKAR